MIRCFLAINLSSEIKEFIKSSFRQWRQINCKVKWVQPENCHITLKFLGETERDLIPKINNALEESLRDFGVFELGLSHAGVFPNASRPRVLWLGLNGEVKKLSRLQRDIEVILKNYGFVPEKRDFIPHITVGRIKKAPFNVELSPFLKTKLPDLKIDVDRFFLMQSTLTSKGPIYTQLRSFQL